MKSVGQAGGALPRAKAGDFERAALFNVSVNGDLETRSYLKELVAAQASHDEARAAAEAATVKAVERDKAAQKAEAAATRARQALVDETEKARTELGRREVGVTERERVATEAEQSQTARAEDLARREGLLREAGVTGF